MHDKYWIWIDLGRDMYMIQLRVNLDLNQNDAMELVGVCDDGTLPKNRKVRP